MSAAETPAGSEDVSDRRPPLPNPIEGQASIAGFIALGCALVAVFGAPFGIAGLIVACIFGTLAVIAGFTALMLARYREKFAAALAEFGRGGGIVHWTYPSDVWSRHLKRERALSQKRDLGSLIVGWIAGIVLAIVVGCLDKWDIVLRILVGGGCLLGGALLGIGFQALTRLSNRSKQRRLERSPPEAYIGTQGLYFAGQYRPWGMLGQRLEGAEFEEGAPPLLIFRYRIRAGEGDFIDHVRVPVPEGGEAVARALAARLS